MFLLNLLPVRHFGQLEYIFGIIKMLFIILMIFFNIIIHNHPSDPDNSGPFWTYRDPNSFGSEKYTFLNRPEVSGANARFFGMWDAMTTNLFGLVGFETIAITAA